MILMIYLIYVFIYDIKKHISNIFQYNIKSTNIRKKGKAK